MDILGVGFPELILIMIIALMVFGPRRLPHIAAKAGKTIRDLRNMSQGLMTEWQREITVASRLEEIEKVRQELSEAGKELTQARKEVVAGTSLSLDEITIAPPAATRSSEDKSTAPTVPEKGSGEKSTVPTSTSSAPVSPPPIEQKPEKVGSDADLGTPTGPVQTDSPASDASPSVLAPKPEEVLNE